MRNLMLSRSSLRAVVAAASIAAFTSCASEFTRNSQSPSFLIVDGITAASGAEPGLFSTFLLSDVVTLVEQDINGETVRVPSIFDDVGRASLRLALRNPGTADLPTTPSPINSITILRYRVNFRRADGRNTPGVDVPYPFDGGVTATIGNSASVVGFELVRHLAKLEPPLKNLQSLGNALFIATIAEVTFYGRDQAGNEVSVMGTITVNFGDFADPE